MEDLGLEMDCAPGSMEAFWTAIPKTSLCVAYAGPLLLYINGKAFGYVQDSHSVIDESVYHRRAMDSLCALREDDLIPDVQ